MARQIMSGGANGKSGKVFVRGTELCIKKWTVEEMAEEEETTNSCSGGFEEYEYGARHLEGSVEAHFDASRNHYDDPPLIRAGEKFPAIFYFNSAAGGTGPSIQVGEIGVSQVSMSAGAKGIVEYSFNFKSSGSYAYNTVEESSQA